MSLRTKTRTAARLCMTLGLALLLACGGIPALALAEAIEEVGNASEEIASVEVAEGEDTTISEDLVAQDADELAGVEAESDALGNQTELLVEEDVEEATVTQEDDPDGSSEESSPVVETQSAFVSNPRRSGQRVTWDCVWFGTYPQTEVTSADPVYSSMQSATWDASGNTSMNGTRYRRISKANATNTDNWPRGSAQYRYFRYDPIKWRVLHVDGSKALVLSDVALDDQLFDPLSELDDDGVAWETSTMRSWLNGYDADSNKEGVDYSGQSFVGAAFPNSGERTAIVRNESDWVLLLDAIDVQGTDGYSYGFAKEQSASDMARQCLPSDFASAMGAGASLDASNDKNCWWWLRSQGQTSYDAANVDSDGIVNGDGDDADCDDGAVRPALYVDLGSTSVTPAGTVSSDGIASAIDANQGKWGTCAWEIKQLGNDIILEVSSGTGADTGGGCPWMTHANAINRVVFHEGEGGEKVVLPADSSALFKGMSNVVFFNLEAADTSQVTNMDCMFEGCAGVASLDLSSFDTSSVASANRMFDGSDRLVEFSVGDRYDTKVGGFPKAQRSKGGAWFSTVDKLAYLRDDIISFRRNTQSGAEGYADTFLDIPLAVGIDTWSWKNTVVDEAFRNQFVSKDQCKQLFGETYGEEIYESNVGEGGICHGMSITAQAASLLSFMPADSYFNDNKVHTLSEVKERQGLMHGEWISSGTKMSALSLACFGQLFQHHETLSKEYKDNEAKWVTPHISTYYKLEKLKKEITEVSPSDPIVIKIYSPEGGGHAIVPTRVVSDDDSETVIGIYDCNYPKEERELVLKKNDGIFCGWEYKFDRAGNEMWGSDVDFFVTTEDGEPKIGVAGTLQWGHAAKLFCECIAAARGSATPAGNNLVVASSESIATNGHKYLYRVSSDVIVCAEGHEYVLDGTRQDETPELIYTGCPCVLPDGSTPQRYNRLFWSNLSDEVTFKGIDEDSTIGVAGPLLGATIHVPAKSEVDETISEGLITVKGADGKRVDVRLYGIGVDEALVSGMCGSAAKVARKGDDIFVSGMNSFSIEACDGSNKVEKADPNKTYRVRISGGSVRVNVIESIGRAKVGIVDSATYTGIAIQPAPTVVFGGRVLKQGTDYILSYKNNVNAGTATVILTGKGNYTGTKSRTFTIAKATNGLKVKKSTKKVKVAKVRKKKQIVKPLKVTGANGAVRYKKVTKGSSKCLSINKKTGKVTIKKGARKGTYKIKVKVSAAGDNNHKAAGKTVTCKVVVK